MASLADYYTAVEGTYKLYYRNREVELVTGSWDRVVIYYVSTDESALFAVPADRIKVVEA